MVIIVGVHGIMGRQFTMLKSVIFITLVLIILSSILFYMEGWRLFGFRLCDSPTPLGIHIESVKEEDGVLVVSGWTMSSAPRFAGYKTKRQGSTVYLGIKTRLFFTKTKLGSFKIEIPIDDGVEKLILTNGSDEREIYVKAD